MTIVAKRTTIVCKREVASVCKMDKCRNERLSGQTPVSSRDVACTVIQEPLKTHFACSCQKKTLLTNCPIIYILLLMNHKGV